MQQKPTANVCTILTVAFLVLNGHKLPAQTEAANVAPVSMTASLTGSSTISEGEPILMRYTVKNSSELPASVYTNKDGGEPLITERFTEAGGQPLIPRIDRTEAHWKTDTLHGWNGLSITGNGLRSWQSLVSTQVTFPHPGNYILQVHVQFPYVMGNIDQGEHYVLDGEYALPLKVVAAQPSYLHTVAERLHSRIMQTTDVEAKATLIQALFSMPEAVAASSWQAMVEEPKLDGEALTEITTSLAHLGTIKSADLLAEIIWNPAQPASAIEEALPADHLYKMYDSGDPALRKHIEDLHKQHGVPMSKYRME